MSGGNKRRACLPNISDAIPSLRLFLGVNGRDIALAIPLKNHTKGRLA